MLKNGRDTTIGNTLK